MASDVEAKSHRVGEVFEQELPCKMTTDEHEKLNQEIADIQSQLMELEVEKKKAVKPLADKAKELTKQNRKLVIQRADGGFAPKPTPVKWEDDGTHVYLVRLDGPVPEEVPKTRRPMTDDDRQLGIPLTEVDLSEVLGKVDAPEDDAPVVDERSPEAIAKRLSTPARKVVRVLLAASSPMDAGAIGSKANCKAGSVLNNLKAKGVADFTEGHDDVPDEDDVAPGWFLTPLGAQVAALLPPVGATP